MVALAVDLRSQLSRMRHVRVTTDTLISLVVSDSPIKVIHVPSWIHFTGIILSVGICRYTSMYNKHVAGHVDIAL